MSKTALQEQVFHQELNDDEITVVQRMVTQHQANAAQTQQLAIDASRLIASSEERLAQQVDSGFFKRFANAVSGKTRAHQLQNQVDTLQVQRIAWHYLQQLQQQNLITAQSIAVIRNNLGVMNDYIIETRDFLEQAIDKINHRLVRVENSINFDNWSRNIEANKRQFKSLPDALLVLRLTYDFMHSHPVLTLAPEEINHLLVTLERLGVNCDDDVVLLEFITDLIEQVKVFGIDRYRSMVALSFEEHEIDAQFVQENISGMAINALYFFSEQYEKIIDLTEDEELCNSDAAREKIISKFFGNEFSGLRTSYKIRELITEIVGGGLLAIDIYKDVNGLNVVADVPAAEVTPEVVSLIPALADITAHSFLDSCRSEDCRHDYLRLLALCLEQSSSMTYSGKEFLTLLSEKAGVPGVLDEIIRIADNPDKYRQYLPVLQTLLDDDDKIYTWLLDAFFLLSRCQLPVESPQILKIIGVLKPKQLKERMPLLLALIAEIDSRMLLDSAAKMSVFARGWKNVLRYRELRFEDVYADVRNRLNEISLEVNLLAMKFDVEQKLSQKVFDVATYVEFDDYDDGFFAKLKSSAAKTASRAFYASGRKSVHSSLNQLREKTRSFIAENASVLREANHMIAQWSLPPIDFDNPVSFSDYELDNSATNEDWYDQFTLYKNQIDDGISKFSSVCDKLEEQLAYFARGEFDTSVVDLATARAQQRAEERKIEHQRQQQEKLEKQSVTLTQDGTEYLFSIQWQAVEQPPCDPEHIRHIKTDGKVWLIVDEDGVLYHSVDRIHWQTIQLPDSDERLSIDKVAIVNDVWLLMMYHTEPFYYSNDALNWQKSQVPSTNNWKTNNIVYFNGLWLWRFSEYADYSYTEEGMIFDSSKTSSYRTSVFYCAKSLGDEWDRWEHTPSLNEGMEVKSVCALPGTTCLLMFCAYDYFYLRNKKKNQKRPSVRYFIPGKSWRTCTWDCEDENFDGNIVIARMVDRFLCFYSDHLLSSDKGYEWERHDDIERIENCFHLDQISLFTVERAWTYPHIYLSQDGQTFLELILEDGNWQYFAANKQGMLCVYAPNQHETFLQIGNFVYQPK